MEVDRPQPVVGFFQTDPLLGKRSGDLQRPLAEAELVVGGDGLDEELPRVVGDEQPRGTGAR